MSDTLRLTLTLNRLTSTFGQTQLAAVNKDIPVDEPLCNVAKIDANLTDQPLSLGTSGQSGFMYMNISHRVTIKSNIADTGFLAGPGLFILESPDESFQNTSFFVTTGPNVTTIQYVTGEVQS